MKNVLYVNFGNIEVKAFYKESDRMNPYKIYRRNIGERYEYIDEYADYYSVLLFIVECEKELKDHGNSRDNR